MRHAISCFFFLACVFIFLSPSFASASEYGIYVAPRFVYGSGDFHKLKWGSDTGGGASGSKQKHDDAFGGALALGVNLRPLLDLPVRAELEYSIFSQMDARGKNTWNRISWDNPGSNGYRENQHSIKQKIDVQTLFLNVYADFPTETRFTPYLTAGLGMAFVSSKSSYDASVTGVNTIVDTGQTIVFDTPLYSGSSSSKRDTNFAWNVGAGLGIALVDDLTVDLAYRFASLGEVKSKSIDTATYSGHSKTQNLYMHQVMVGLRWEFW